MIRKVLAATVAITALFFGALSLSADANITCAYSFANTTDCADAVAYPGPFSNHPPAPTGPYGWGSLNIVAGSADGTGGGDAGGGLAHTGSDADVLAYMGVGLVAFGAVALGSRRKFFQGALD